MSGNENKYLRTGAKSTRPGDVLEKGAGEEVDVTNIMFCFLRDS